jgi:hypothetical protein
LNVLWAELPGHRYFIYFFESTTSLVTTRSKRWNGNLDTLPIEYLKSVMEKMGEYGDRVKFSLVAGGPQPSYQVMNTVGKTMAFDKNHHLLHLQGDEFVGANASVVLTLDQVKARISGVGANTGARSRTTRAAGAGNSGSRTTAARLHDQFATQRYEYFRNNRQTLPPTISEHSDEITDLMKKGKSVEDAFSEVIKKYY